MHFLNTVLHTLDLLYLSRVAESNHSCSQVQCLKAVITSNQDHFSYRANTKQLYKDKPYEKSSSLIILFNTLGLLFALLQGSETETWVDSIFSSDN